MTVAWASASGFVAFQLAGERGDVAVADAVLQAFGKAGFEHLREAAQLALDGIRLSDEDFENAVFLAVGVDEVVAEDLGFGLELAVDPAVALFETAGVPRDVEVE